VSGRANGGLTSQHVHLALGNTLAFGRSSKEQSGCGRWGPIAAVVLAVIAGWLALGRFGSRGESWRQANLDLRGHEAFRGAGAPKTAPLKLARGRLELTLDLPTGSEPGDYDVQLTTFPINSTVGRSLWRAREGS
jgi:hypothetical protein